MSKTNDVDKDRKDAEVQAGQAATSAPSAPATKAVRAAAAKPRNRTVWVCSLCGGHNILEG